MEQTILLEVRLDFKDAISVAENKHDNILPILQNKYTHKIFKGYYIDSIEEVSYVGEIIFNLSDNQRSAGCDVLFTAKGRVVSHGYMCVGIMDKFTESHARLNTDIARVAIKKISSQPEIDMNIFTKDQLVPIIVNSVKSPTNSSQYDVIGNLWTPIFNPKIIKYVVSGDINFKEFKKMIEIADMKKQELLKHKDFEKYKNLMYPYTEDRSLQVPKTKIHSLANIINKSVPVKIITFDPRLYWYIDGHIVVSDEDEIGTYEHSDLKGLMNLLLLDYIYHLNMFISLLNTYAGREKEYNKLFNLWNYVKTKNSINK